MGDRSAGLVEGKLDLATYEYRCDAHGVMEQSQPMGLAADIVPCRVCGDDAIRVFSAPMVALAPKPIVAAIDPRGEDAFRACGGVFATAASPGQANSDGPTESGAAAASQTLTGPAAVQR